MMDYVLRCHGATPVPWGQPSPADGGSASWGPHPKRSESSPSGGQLERRRRHPRRRAGSRGTLGLGDDALTPPPATLSDLRHLFRGQGATSSLCGAVPKRGEPGARDTRGDYRPRLPEQHPTSPTGPRIAGHGRLASGGSLDNGRATHAGGGRGRTNGNPNRVFGFRAPPWLRVRRSR